MDVYDSHALTSILALLRSGIWILVIAEALAGHQAKRVGYRLAAKADHHTLETPEECGLPGAGRASHPDRG